MCCRRLLKTCWRRGNRTVLAFVESGLVRRRGRLSARAHRPATIRLQQQRRRPSMSACATDSAPSDHNFRDDDVDDSEYRSVRLRPLNNGAYSFDRLLSIFDTTLNYREYRFVSLWSQFSLSVMVSCGKLRRCSHELIKFSDYIIVMKWKCFLTLFYSYLHSKGS